MIQVLLILVSAIGASGNSFRPPGWSPVPPGLSNHVALGSVSQLASREANPLVLPVPSDATAKLQINVPEDAQIIVDGMETKATGAVREFEISSIAPGQTYTSSVEVYTRRGGLLRRMRSPVTYGAGDRRVMTFNESSGTCTTN